MFYEKLGTVYDKVQRLRKLRAGPQKINRRVSPNVRELRKKIN
mgnify:CR=1 FL=1